MKIRFKAIDRDGNVNKFKVKDDGTYITSSQIVWCRDCPVNGKASCFPSCPRTRKKWNTDMLTEKEED